MIGKEFRLDDVAALLQPEAAPTAEAHMGTLTARGFVRPVEPGEFAFRHVLLQEAVYRAAPKRLRAELHERFIDRFEERRASTGDVDEFAGYHLEQAYRLRTFNAWINNSDLNRDIGFVTTYSGGDWGARVVDTVGGHGLAYNGGTEFDVSIFGYPSNRDGGNKMWACWGVATDTDDREGAVLAESAARPDAASITAALPRFVGTVLQRPPAYSALKIAGRRAYALARTNFEAGALPLVDLLDADRQRAAARLQAATARNDAAKEWAALQIATGAGAAVARIAQ